MSTPSIAYPTSLKMARSPIFYTGKNNTLTNDSLDAMTLRLKIYSGTSAPSTYNYVLSKSYSINEVINFEVSDLIRSEFSHDFSVYDASFYEQSPINEALWISAGGSDWTYSDNGTVPQTALIPSLSLCLTTQGWADKLNPTNPAVTSPVLAVDRTRYVLISNYESLAIYNSVANGLAFISIEWNNGVSAKFWNTDGSSAFPPDPTSYDTQDLVIYAGIGPANLEANAGLDAEIKPSAHNDGDYYDVVLISGITGDEIARVRYTLVCEPKYTPYQVSFVNRYGVADFITFFKVSTEQGNFTNDQYKRSIYQDGFTTPSLQVGQYQDFNVNSRNSITMNTGWVDEDYDDVIEDILMSENCAILINGSWVAANPQRGNVQYQKEVNSKNINYTLTFDVAFNERSLIR